MNQSASLVVNPLLLKDLNFNFVYYNLTKKVNDAIILIQRYVVFAPFICLLFFLQLYVHCNLPGELLFPACNCYTGTWNEKRRKSKNNQWEISSAHSAYDMYKYKFLIANLFLPTSVFGVGISFWLRIFLTIAYFYLILNSFSNILAGK